MARKTIGKSLIYLASPYTHLDPFIREERYLTALRAVHYFTLQEMVVFSPIVHAHPLAKIASLPFDFMQWESINHTFIDKSDELFVLMMDGWTTSKGVRDEIDYAHNKAMVTRYFAPHSTTMGLSWTEEYAAQVDPLLKR